MGFPRWGEVGEIVGNCATLHNERKEAGAIKIRVGTGIKGYGKQEV